MQYFLNHKCKSERSWSGPT